MTFWACLAGQFLKFHWQTIDRGNRMMKRDLDRLRTMKEQETKQ